jgi:outer membrane protein assembly factor BamE (lipoprotein component of BamABCDE complex)
MAMGEKKYLTPTCALLAVFVLFGCATTQPRPLTQETTVGTKFTQETISKIKEGVTTKAEVRSILGPPPIVNLTGDGKEIWMYNYSQYRMPLTQKVKLDPKTGPTVIDKRHPEVYNQITQVLFTKEGIVEKIIHTSSGSEIKTNVVVE